MEQIELHVTQAIDLLNNVLGIISAKKNYKPLFKLHSFSAPLTEKDCEMPRKLMLCGRMRTLRKRKDGRWELRLAHKGTRYCVYDKNQEKCIAKFKDVYKNRDKMPKKPPKSSPTLNEWIEIWYETYKAKTLKESSLASIRYCRKKIASKIGGILLVKITSLEIQSFLNSIEGSRQRQITKNHLSNIFKYAVKNNLIKTNPMSAVEVKHQTAQKEILTQEQQRQLIQSIENEKFRLLIRVYLATGIRRQEALVIKKEDIDINNLTIRIRGTKTKSSARIVPIPKKLAEELLATDSESFLFEYRGEYVSKTFRAICDKIGFKKITVHSLRHTFATNCLRCGIPMKVVQSILGHASINITSDLYTHITNDIAFKEFTKVINAFDHTFDHTFDHKK